jgi:hypothetical protein
MSAPFQPGDVVVCVDDRQSPYSPHGLLRGAYYRIAGLRPPMYNSVINEKCLGVELVAPESGNPNGYGAFRFRKIDDEVTDEFRAQLRSLNTPAKQKMPVEVGE